MTVEGLVIATGNQEKAAIPEMVAAHLAACPRIRESIATHETAD